MQRGFGSGTFSRRPRQPQEVVPHRLLDSRWELAAGLRPPRWIDRMSGAEPWMMVRGRSAIEELVPTKRAESGRQVESN